MLKHKLLIFILIGFFQSCSGQTGKIKGLSFVASHEPISEKHVKPVLSINANYVSIMPFGFIRDINYPDITFNAKRQWFGETKQGAKQYINEIRKKSIKIMLKPQIWVWRGEYTGSIKMSSETNWELLEESYSKFILEYAQLAQDLKVELFCIGTELEQFVINRPKYWDELIVKIKKVYKGKLTYAANWNEFDNTHFWNRLDFIGIDAYFPVSDKKTPSVVECLLGWEKYKEAIKSKQKQFNKPVLFTEFGYRSVDFSAKEPWDASRKMTVVNLEAQTNATKALFQEFWKEDWFAGGFVWKWYHDHEVSGGEKNDRFTPQNKPAEKIIKAYFSES